MRLHHLCRRDNSFGKWKVPRSDVWDLIGRNIVWFVDHFLSGSSPAAKTAVNVSAGAAEFGFISEQYSSICVVLRKLTINTRCRWKQEPWDRISWDSSVRRLNEAACRCSYAYWPTDGAQRQSFLPVTGRDTVCEVHTCRLNKTWCLSYAFSSATSSSLHFITVWLKLHLIFSFHIRVVQGLITQSEISTFIVIIESSKVVSIIISQQGINRDQKEKH